MSTSLDTSWDELVSRLRLGIEPRDALDPTVGPAGPPAGLQVHSEQVPAPHPLPRRIDDSIGLPALRRSRSGRFAILFGDRRTDAPARLAVRVVDRTRRLVPRRLSVPVPTLAEVTAADDRAYSVARACRPLMFPAPAYGPPPGATAVRGRVVRGPQGRPVPWARVEARLPGAAAPSWFAHADGAGEFLLVIGPLAQALANALTGLLDLEVTAYGRPPPAEGDPVDSPSRSRADPLWLLPVEQVGALSDGDPVAAGVTLPTGYTLSAGETISCRRGGIVRADPLLLP